MDYLFLAFTGDDAGSVVMKLPLASDIEASVRSFDLMRNHPAYQRVVVLRAGQPVFQRTRVGGKLELFWSSRGAQRQSGARPIADPFVEQGAARRA